MKIKTMAFVALFTAALCVIAPFSIPVGPVPLSLATFGIYLAAALLDWKYGTLSVLLYVLLGAVGLPVFSGFSGGFHRLAGATGGYIVGYILMALVIGLLIRCFGQRRPWLWTPLAMIAGTAALYTLGTVWYIIQAQIPLSGVGGALLLCVVPFLPGDAVKIAVAAAVAVPLRRSLRRIFGN